MMPIVVMSNLLAATAFRALCLVGRPIGGVRPRRIYHWLAKRAWPPGQFNDDQFRWYGDRWGHRFRLHPYFHIDREIIAFGSYDPELMTFIHAEVKPGMVCLDIGANMGIVTVHLAGLVQESGRVHAFEPVPHVRERLVGHLAENRFSGRVEVHPVALSDSNASATMSIADPRLEDNQGMSTLVNPEHPKLSDQIEVETVRLDDFVEGRKLERLDWMKVDIQGAEPLMLRGGERTLERFGPSMLMEVAPADLRGMGMTPPDLLSMLEQLDYRTFELEGSTVGRELHSDRVSDDFIAENVLARRKDKVG